MYLHLFSFSFQDGLLILSFPRVGVKHFSSKEDLLLQFLKYALKLLITPEQDMAKEYTSMLILN